VASTVSKKEARSFSMLCLMCSRMAALLVIMAVSVWGHLRGRSRDKREQASGVWARPPAARTVAKQPQKRTEEKQKKKKVPVPVMVHWSVAALVVAVLAGLAQGVWPPPKALEVRGDTLFVSPELQLSDRQ
jgi:hypothetical protein